MNADQQKIADDYAAAYLRANGSPVAVTYARGWFRLLHGPQRQPGDSYRAAELVQLTANLNARRAA